MYRTCKKLFYRLLGQPREYHSDYQLMSQTRRVLDVPCGQGFFLRNAPESMIGIDANPAAIEKCISQGLRATIGNVFHLPFESAHFDGVHCAHLIEHFLPCDAMKMLVELDRVLAAGGVLVIRTPMPDDYFYGDPTHIKPYPPSAVINLMNMTRDGDPTITNEQFNYDFVSLKFYGRVLFQTQVEVSLAPRRYPFRTLAKAVGLLLSRIGIRHWKAHEYRIVLRKRSARL